MGPVRFAPGKAVDVRPHPHIGLATVTYLFEGALMHRDSLGFVQRITPGDVNWMTAGHGIVHSERSPDEERDSARTLHGIQVWIALPAADEQTEPAFTHHPQLPSPRARRPCLNPERLSPLPPAARHVSWLSAAHRWTANAISHGILLPAGVN
jgi:redox-sensitive bicupin YhaK (pirin superfamily)